MIKRFRYISFSSVVLITLMVSLLLPTAALADDGTPPPTDPTSVVVTPDTGGTNVPTDVVATQPASTDVAPTDAAPTDVAPTDAAPTDVAPTDVAPTDAAPTDAVAAQPASTDAAPTDAAPTDAVVTEAPVTETVVTTETPAGTTQSADLTGVVASIANANAVVTDANGNPIPLASQQAADVLSNGDPYVVRGGVTNRFLTDCTGQPIDASNTCTVSATPIQAAITFAVAGETVYVGAGTYVEQIVINKSLTLVGAGAGTTFIQAPTVLASDPDGTKTIALFTGSISAEFSGFTVQGPVDGLNYGIYVRNGATANIHDNIIKDISNNPLDGAQNGVAIEVGKQSKGQTGTATITNNQISGYQKNGVTISGTGSSANITGNTVTGAGPSNTIAQNGI